MPPDEYCLILFSHPLLPEVVSEFQLMKVYVQFNEVNVYNLKFSWSLIYSREFNYSKKRKDSSMKWGSLLVKRNLLSVIYNNFLNRERSPAQILISFNLSKEYLLKAMSSCTVEA